MNATGIRFVPIELWPGAKRTSRQRIKSPFRGGYKNTLDTLERELAHLAAKDRLIQAFFQPHQIRMDGWPRSSESPSEPGVIVSFSSKSGGDLAFPCDTYTYWQDNLRAIALALAALRAVQRYGVTRQSEQYKGWAKLPPAPEAMGDKDALAFLALHGGVEHVSSANFQGAYRAAALRLHPDTNGGNVHLFHLLQSARETITERYGWK